MVTIECTTSNSQGRNRFTCLAIDVTSIFTWNNTPIIKQTRTHKSATAGINAVNRLSWRTEDTSINDNIRIGLRRINHCIWISRIIWIIAFYRNKFSLCICVRTIEHNSTVRIPICDMLIHSRIFIISNAVVTTCTSTEDSAENHILLWVIFRKDSECSAIDCHRTVSIEWILDSYTASKTTSSTAAIKLCDDNLAIVTISRVNKDISPTRIGVVRESVVLTVIIEIEVFLISHVSVYHTSHVSALNDDIQIGIHRSLM